MEPIFEFVAYEPGDPVLGIGCPKCWWEFPEDMIKYIVVNGGIKVITNYWKLVDGKDMMAGEKQDDEVVSPIEEKIYPVYSNFGTDAHGGDTWDETHCCPKCGEFTFDNGWY